MRNTCRDARRAGNRFSFLADAEMRQLSRSEKQPRGSIATEPTLLDGDVV
jgi:hypothetical protein